MSILFFLGASLLVIFVFGRILQRIRVPWIFSALIYGLGLVAYNPFGVVTTSDTLKTFSDIGLYLLLFLIGFQLNIKEILQNKGFIIKATIFIEAFELLLVGVFLHFVFGISWFTAFLVSLSFATIGEAILLPILDEFGMTKTKLGQLILGIATFDDVFEILVVILIILAGPVFLHTQSFSASELFYSGFVFAGLSALTLIFSFSQTIRNHLQLHIHDKAAILVLLLSILLIFVGIGEGSVVDISVIGAIFAGIIAKELLPKDTLEEVEKQIKYITFGFFAPLFFLSVGLETDVTYLIHNIWIVLVIIFLAKFAKISASLIIGKKELGLYPALFMGVALGVRFSTSIVVLKILLDNGLIHEDLYSVLIGTAILFKFIIPFLLSFLGKKVTSSTTKNT